MKRMIVSLMAAVLLTGCASIDPGGWIASLPTWATPGIVDRAIDAAQSEGVLDADDAVKVRWWAMHVSTNLNADGSNLLDVIVEGLQSDEWKDVEPPEEAYEVKPLPPTDDPRIFALWKWDFNIMTDQAQTAKNLSRMQEDGVFTDVCYTYDMGPKAGWMDRPHTTTGADSEGRIMPHAKANTDMTLLAGYRLVVIGRSDVVLKRSYERVYELPSALGVTEECDAYSDKHLEWVKKHLTEVLNAYPQTRAILTSVEARCPEAAPFVLKVVEWLRNEKGYTGTIFTSLLGDAQKIAHANWSETFGKYQVVSADSHDYDRRDGAWNSDGDEDIKDDNSPAYLKRAKDSQKPVLYWRRGQNDGPNYERERIGQ